MEKLRFEFTLTPSGDGKSNIMAITSIATDSGESFGIPEDLQLVSLHKEVMKTSVYTKVKNSLKKRYQVRKVWITLTEELANTYIDEDGNIQFLDQYLEEMNENKQ